MTQWHMVLKGGEGFARDGAMSLLPTCTAHCLDSGNDNPAFCRLRCDMLLVVQTEHETPIWKPKCAHFRAVIGVVFCCDGGYKDGSLRIMRSNINQCATHLKCVVGRRTWSWSRECKGLVSSARSYCKKSRFGSWGWRELPQGL